MTSSDAVKGVVGVDDAVAVVQHVLGRKGDRDTEVGNDTRFDQLEFDSLDVAELFVALEERTGEDLDPESGQGIETVGDLTRLRTMSAADEGR